MRFLALAVVVGCALGASGARAVTRAEGEVLTTMVATAASNDPRIDVVTMADLQKVVALAADRQLVDCKAAEACLAEVAAAMDAAAVLHGKLGTLGDQVVLNLSLFDTTTSTAVGRATAMGRDTGALAGRIDEAVLRLLEKVPASTTGRKVRVLVMDIDIAGASAGEVATVDAPPARPAPPASSPWSSWPAWTGVGAGALGVVAGVVAYLQASDHDAKARDANNVTDADAEYGQRDAWATGMVACGVGALVGLAGAGVAIGVAYAE